MADDIEVRLGADTGNLESGMDRGAGAVKDATQKIEQSLKSVETVGVALGTIIGDLLVNAIKKLGDTIKSTVTDTAAYRAETEQLARVMGTSTAEASTMAQALDNIYVSTEEFTAAAKGMERQIRTKEEAMNKMGLVTRDQNGNLRDLNSMMTDAVGILNTYKAGSDRNVASQELFGRGLKDGSRLLDLNTEQIRQAIETNQELGLVVGKEATEDFDNYRASMKNVDDAIQGLKNAVGNALLPVLTKLADWFRAIAPAAITVVKGALGGLVSVFWGLQLSIQITWEVIRALFNQMVDGFKEVGDIMLAILQGRWSDVPKLVGEYWNKAKANAQNSMDAIVEKATATQERLRRLFADQTPDDGPGKDGKAAETKPPKKTGADPRFAEWKSQLEQMKEDEGDFFKSSLEMEEQFWQKKLAAVTGSGKEDVKLRQQIGHELYSIHKQQAQMERQLDEEAITQAQKKGEGIINAERESLQLKRDMHQISAEEEAAGMLELANREYSIQLKAFQDKANLYANDKLQRQKVLNEIELLEQKHASDVAKIYADLAKQQVAINQQLEEANIDHMRRMRESDLASTRETLELKRDLGIIKDQEMLVSMRALSEQEYQIELESLQAKVELYNQDVIAKQRVLDQIAELERKHALDVQKINDDILRQQKRELDQMLAPITSAIEKSVTGMIQGTLTMQKALRQILQSILAEFVSMIARRTVAWITGEHMKTAATAAGTAERTALEQSASATSILTSAGAVIKNIMNYAAETFAAIYKALAGIPFIGPFIAPAAAAAGMGVVAGMTGSVMSAEGGFDIPSGVNPMVQTHQKEMILPAKYADMIRGMAEGGLAGAGAGGNAPIYLKTTGGDFIHKNDLARLIKQLGRNFVPVK